MKKVYHSLAVVLTIIIMANFTCIGAFAAEPAVQNNDLTEFIDILHELNISEEDIAQLCELAEQQENNNTISVPEFPSFTLSSFIQPFPSNPKEGDTFKKTIYVSKGTMATAAGGTVGIIAALITKGVDPGIAALVGAYVANLIADNSDFQGVYINQYYRYGETDEGTIGWTKGYSDWTVKY